MRISDWSSDVCSSDLFDLGAPVLSQSTSRPGEGVTVTVPVTNRGGMAGDEVVQIYLRDDVSSVTRPVKELVGFRRVTLKPAETRQVAISLRTDASALRNADMERVLQPRRFTIQAGAREAGRHTGGERVDRI